jgi:hypothetical protein
MLVKKASYWFIEESKRENYIFQCKMPIEKSSSTRQERQRANLHYYSSARVSSSRIRGGRKIAQFPQPFVTNNKDLYYYYYCNRIYYCIRTIYWLNNSIECSVKLFPLYS